MLGSCSVNAEHQELREDAAPQSPPLHVPPVLPGRAHALELRLCPIRVCIHTSAEQNNSNIGRGFVDGHKSGFVSVSRSKRLELRADSQEVVLDSFKACAAGRTPDLSEKASCQARRSGHWSHLTKLPGRASLWTPLSPSVSLLSCVCCLLEQRSQESQCELLLTSCENVAMLKSQLLVSAELLTDSQGHMFLEEETGDGQGTQDVKAESWTPPSNKSSLLPKESHIEVSFHRRACAYASMNSFRVVSPFSWTAPLENETCSSVQKTVQNNIRDWASCVQLPGARSLGPSQRSPDAS
ncbi:uncharacterized protein LOC124102903 [Marmota monax]|uniref:uncharacterized protein LOC124102903 n=1 Tax=Marmota monax TaxID=9995 RepID=UPI0026F0686E|nr:uncharacterized protein LOC124102903 [Marmota monax]